jgi:hypothetical protein
VEIRVLYLDVDDEITTAAARIRGSDGTRIGLVLPNGSRVSTSRINFRLLARDATLNGKRLSIVAPDPATRALAASAGLPIFSSVAEYESAIELERSSKAGAEGEPAAAAGAAAAGAAAAGASATPGARSPRGTGGRKPRGTKPAGDETMTTAVPPAIDESPTGMTAAGAAAAGAAAARAAAADGGLAEPQVPLVPQVQAHRAPAAVPAARVVADTPDEPPPPPPMRVAGSRVVASSAGRQWGALRTPLLVGTAVLVLALVVGSVGAYLFLPTATAVIAPRETAIGPVALNIVASPTATAPDPAAKTVPAVTTDVPVEATQTFEVTGKRVEEKTAAGTVRFRNKDFTSTNTVPRGSIVSTQSGVRFRTDRSVTVPRAELVGLQIFPASANVKVTAVKAGPSGNVEPNTILVIPRGEDPLTLDVTNPDETSGGEREEFPRVVEADIEAATKAIEAGLASAFAEKLADPSLAEGLTVFPETGSLGEPTFTTDPASLLNDEIETFELGATATGSVLAVDESSVEEVAEANIAPQVQAGYSLVDGSSQVEASPGQVEGGVITFPATITARQVLEIDPAAIEAEIRGKSLEEARSILDRYGRSQLQVWPDWVGTIPTLDARVDVRTATEAEPP